MPASPPEMLSLRLGLCCKFNNEPDVRFRTTTVRYISTLPSEAARPRLFELAHSNAEALRHAVRACARLNIAAFRVNSNLLPLATHPNFAYSVSDLPARTYVEFRRAGEDAARAGVRFSFHPDQFVLLGSESESVTDMSISELTVQGELSELIGADVINLHAGGGYGDKAAALGRLRRNLARLPAAARSRLTLENDDRIYTVRDLLPLCREEGVPLVYDVHHHRCNPDGLDIAEATRLSVATWNREPLFHLSSPKAGWSAPNPRHHSDFIDIADFPSEWFGMQLTIDVEAKAKELAVLDLRQKLAERINREVVPSGEITRSA